MTYEAHVPQPHPATPLSGVTAVGLWAIFISLIFLQRFAIGGVPIGYGLSYAAIVAFVLLGALVIDVTFLIFFLIAVAIACLSIFWWPADVSIGSFLYLISIYALYMLRFRNREATLAKAHDIFLNCMVLAAIIGIVQFALQFVIGAEAVFPLETLPESLLAANYNVIIPLTYGSAIVKSNGVFFLEPSFFSQFLAVALLLEMLGRQRAVRCLLYLSAMVLSYSGTGMLTVLLFAPFVLARRFSLPIVLGAVIVTVVVLLSATVLEFDTLFGRVEEFAAPESSGFARFISPFYLIRDFLLPSPDNFLFGMGPGTITDALQKATFHAYLAHDPTWIKLLFEYGLVGGLAILSYVIAASYTGSPDRLFTTVLLVVWSILGGYLLNGLMNVLILSLAVLHGRTAVPAFEPTPATTHRVPRGRPLGAHRLTH